ncbi:MAG: hypothetical protein GF311_04095 [Candidatus Lokiarchaeota archaeon]|nr:hypothetical protein [Candidatus Lokiarchaeota archaeon]
MKWNILYIIILLAAILVSMVLFFLFGEIFLFPLFCIFPLSCGTRNESSQDNEDQGETYPQGMRGKKNDDILDIPIEPNRLNFYCPTCGELIDQPNLNYCPKCGNKLPKL